MHLRKTRRLAGEVSLSEALEQDEDGSGLSLMDVIRVDDTMLEDLEHREERERLRKCVAHALNEREQFIITRRYGLDGKAPMAQREVAQLCGISRSYISRLEKQALSKLRWALTEQSSVSMAGNTKP